MCVCIVCEGLCIAFGSPLPLSYTTTTVPFEGVFPLSSPWAGVAQKQGIPMLAPGPSIL